MPSVLTVDVEDWFHILDLPATPPCETWDALPSRVEMNFRKLLELLARNNVRATCFFLGWVAERFPQLVREAAAQGHEIASHGYSHQLAYHMLPEEFLQDIQRARLILEDVSGQPVLGYRAPGFSASKFTPWFFMKIVEAGYRYDSSVFPGSSGHGGMADCPLAPYVVSHHPTSALLEFPMSVIQTPMLSLCFFGGGYLRLFPWRLTKFMAARVRKQGRPVIFYVHPREIDPGHPRLPMNAMRAFKSYVNLGTTYSKLEHMVQELEFTTFQDLLKMYWPEFAHAIPKKSAASAGASDFAGVMKQDVWLA